MLRPMRREQRGQRPMKAGRLVRYRTLNAAQFGQEVRRAFPQAERRKTSGKNAARRIWVYRGIALDSEPLPVDQHMLADETCPS